MSLGKFDLHLFQSPGHALADLSTAAPYSLFQTCELMLFAMFRDLMSWINGIMALVTSDELAKDVASAEALLDRHQVITYHKYSVMFWRPPLSYLIWHTFKYIWLFVCWTVLGKKNTLLTRIVLKSLSNN